MKKKNLISNIVLGLSVVLLVLALYFSYMSQNKDRIFIFGYKPFVVTTGSMEPEFPVNTLVVIQETDSDSIQVGDTIAFYSSTVNANVFHRVVAITDQGFVTKGDNNDAVDSNIVSSQDVLGRSVFHTTVTVYLFTLIQSPVRLVLFVLVPILALYIALHFYKKYRKQKARIDL